MQRLFRSVAIALAGAMPVLCYNLVVHESAAGDPLYPIYGNRIVIVATVREDPDLRGLLSAADIAARAQEILRAGLYAAPTQGERPRTDISTEVHEHMPETSTGELSPEVIVILLLCGTDSMAATDRSSDADAIISCTDWIGQVQKGRLRQHDHPPIPPTALSFLVSQTDSAALFDRMLHDRLDWVVQNLRSKRIQVLNPEFPK